MVQKVSRFQISMSVNLVIAMGWIGLLARFLAREDMHTQIYLSKRWLWNQGEPRCLHSPAVDSKMITWVFAPCARVVSQSIVQTHPIDLKILIGSRTIPYENILKGFLNRFGEFRAIPCTYL